MKLLLVLALVSSSLLLLVNAEYRWDADAQEWVLVDDETPAEDSSDDTGGSGYDDEDYGYDDEAGSGDDSYDRHGGYNTPNIDNQSSNKNGYDSGYGHSNTPEFGSPSNPRDDWQAPEQTPTFSQTPGQIGNGNGVIPGPEIIDGPPVVPTGDDRDLNVNFGSNGQSNHAGGSGDHHSQTTFFAKSGTMAAVIMGAVVGLLCAILCVMFVVYRMRKKDEGSYALDEPKRSPTANSYSKPPNREFYA